MTYTEQHLAETARIIERLDHAAIDHLREVAAADSLTIEAAQADLRDYPIGEAFDSIVSIGLLMFFDCPTALRTLAELQAHVRPGGTAIVNVLVEGTTYFDMFDAAGHCLFARDELLRRFAGWTILMSENVDYPAPGGESSRSRPSSVAIPALRRRRRHSQIPALVAAPGAAQRTCSVRMACDRLDRVYPQRVSMRSYTMRSRSVMCPSVVMRQPAMRHSRSR